MVDIKHSSKLSYTNPELHSTGNMPSSVALEACRASFNYHVNYMRHGQIAQYWGRPDSSVNAEFDSAFYIITDAVTPADTSQTTRNIGIQCQCWDITDAAAEESTATVLFKWDTVTKFTVKVNKSTAQDDAYDEVPKGPYYEGVLTCSQASPTNGFVSNVFEVVDALVSTLSVFDMPETELTNDAAYNLAPGNFGVGQFLKGWDTTASNSVDTLAQYQNSNASNPTESMMHNSRRCLFQWCDPAGLYVVGVGGSLAWTDCMKTSGDDRYDFKITPRNLRGRSYASDSDTSLARMAVVVKADPNTKIRFTSTVTADTLEIDMTPGYASATLLVASSGLEIAPEGDEIRVEVYVSTAAAVEIKTMSLWEDSSGEEI